MTERKYFLDWLRVIAFGLLTVFHVGLMYASWGYVFKSPRLAPEIEWVLVLVTPWRIVLLFFISGVACRFLMSKLTLGAFTRDRLLRLVPVILLGMYVINPTQNYIELLVEGAIDNAYLDFWLGTYLTSAELPGRMFPTWDHLWFLVYLLVYILVLALLNSLAPGAFGTKCAPRVPMGLLIVAPASWLVVSNYLVDNVQPSTFALVNDWAVHIRSAGLFGFGVLAAFHDRFWDWCKKHRTFWLVASATLFALLVIQRALSQKEFFEPIWFAVTRSLITGLYGWSMILTLAGFASRYLAQPSRLLSYLTVAILPIYVVHQPLMIFAAWRLFPLELPLVIEGTLLVSITCFGSLLLYEVFVRRFDFMRLVFGLKRI